LANFSFDHVSQEIENQQEVLFLDDILNFSISGRRLIELAKLKTFASHSFIPQQAFDSAESPNEFRASGTRISFLKFINSIIHAQYLRLFRSKIDFWRYHHSGQAEKDAFAYYSFLEKVGRERRWNDYSIDPVVLVVSGEDEMVLSRLKDVIRISCAVVEKIIAVCDEFQIYLEKDMRSIE
jgi:hypothetical protein